MSNDRVYEIKDGQYEGSWVETSTGFACSIEDTKTGVSCHIDIPFPYSASILTEASRTRIINNAIIATQSIPTALAVESLAVEGGLDG